METCLRVIIYVLIFFIVFLLSLLIAYDAYTPAKFNFDSAPVGSCMGDVNHCGCCGNCSTTQDYDLYLSKNDTLSEEARKCALDNLFEDSDACMEEIGMTPGCAYCWAENVRCTRSNCLFPCMMETWLGIASSQNGTLSKCFACDEVNCLDGFIKCAGMSRRRAGIETDIVRDISEVCDVSKLELAHNC